MRLVYFFILLVFLSSFALADAAGYPENYSLDIDFNFSSFVKSEGDNISFAKIIGGLVLAFLLISGIYVFKKRKSKND